ncbi:MAG: DUF1778 domain-containing protein [Psychrosphaera sp.]|nr:DUF1778 domain-containing protein [Psychrosphaera sp.]
MTTARLDLRLDAEIKAKAEKASALLGLKSLTEYVVRLMDEDATKVVAAHQHITLEQDDFDRFITACDETKLPNQALLDAAAFAKAQGFK